MSQPPTSDESGIVYGWADAPVSGDRIDLHEGPIVAGDPGGARVEVTEDGLRAFDSTGTETARIQGEGGEFVGGSFRTSDDLHGQVRLSDTALQYGTHSGPGISVEPSNALGYTRLPGIGPLGDYITFTGGENDNGRSAMQLSPTVAYMWASDADGDYSQIYTSPIVARIERRDQNDNLQGRIGIYGQQAQIHAGDLENYSSLIANANGIRIVIMADGVRRDYDLEETAQDSGWQALTLTSGLAGGWSPAWRNKGGVIYMRGRVTKTSGNWEAGWNVLATDIGADARPSSHIQRAGATRGAGPTFLEVTTGGTFQVWFDAATPGGTTVELSPMFYPRG